MSRILNKSYENPGRPQSVLLTRLEDELHKREQRVIAQKAVHSDGQQPGSLVPLPRLMIVFDYLPRLF